MWISSVVGKRPEAAPQQLTPEYTGRRLRRLIGLCLVQPLVDGRDSWSAPSRWRQTADAPAVQSLDNRCMVARGVCCMVGVVKGAAVPTLLTRRTAERVPKSPPPTFQRWSVPPDVRLAGWPAAVSRSENGRSPRYLRPVYLSRCQLGADPPTAALIIHDVNGAVPACAHGWWRGGSWHAAAAASRRPDEGRLQPGVNY